MEPAKYSALIAELEKSAQDSPQAMRWRTFLMVGTGYGYVLSVLLIVVGAALAVLLLLLSGKGAGAAFKLLIPLGALAWFIIRSLWVTISPPIGRPLPPGRAPALEHRVEEIRAALAAPRADTILLTDDFNAAVVQIPRLGIFGWPRTYLLLGVPLLVALEPGQLDAVLAHEFAHLSGSHPKRGLWVHRIGRTWQQLLDGLEHAGTVSKFLFERFMGWYVPRLQAYAIVMSRQDEFAADADAARITSPAALGSALAALETRQAALGNFWRGIWSDVEHTGLPPQRTWSLLPDRLRQQIDTAAANALLARALMRATDESDTHPALAERLRALGVDDPLSLSITAPARSAAEHYMRELLPDLLASFEREWHESTGETWRETHAAAVKNRVRLDQLLARENAGELLPLQELWELSSLIADLRAESEAEPYWRRVLAQVPNHAGAHFRLGGFLLARGDAAGVEHLEMVMTEQRDAIPPVCDLLYRFYVSRNDQEGLARVRCLWHEFGQAENAADAERRDVSKRDTFVAADLPADDVTQLRRLAFADTRINRLWVVRKLTTHRSDRPHFVFVIERRAWRLGRWGRNDRALAQSLVDSLDLSLPSDYLVIVAGWENAWLLKRVAAASVSCVAQR